MRYYSHPVLSGLLLLSFASCSGGGAADATLRVRCADGLGFCVISCDLGCSQTGCAITEIAENQKLRFVFSDRLAADSVNNSSVSIRTATGVSPDGDLLVNGNELTFKPSVSTVAGVSSFGFQRNETYIITLAGGPTAALGISSVTGDRLASEFSCTVIASRGIADEDQQPPSVELVSPADPTAAPLDPTVVLRFSELIDTTPLRGELTAASPIRFTLRPTRLVGGELVCDRDAQAIVLGGAARLSTEVVGDHPVTVVSFKPTVQLPGQSCIEVAVLSDLRDLSGRPAVSTSFQFLTIAGTPTQRLYTEAFESEINMDQQLSGGSWGGVGAGARPAQIGGDGRHGTFDPALATGASSSEYTWDTNLVTIPGSLSLNGTAYPVTDGKFYFTDFTLPAGVTLNFVGPVPPIIHVRGKATINGSIKLNGAAMTTHNGRGTLAAGVFVNGQVGGAPGAFGGRGGNGGRECEGNGPISQNGVDLTNGQNGEDVRIMAGRAYASTAVATGGRGSAMKPTNGEANPITPLIGFAYRSHFAPGGSGGGFMLPGGLSTVTPVLNLQIGAVPGPGGQFPMLQFPTTGFDSLTHFLVGGSGGGGGGTHAFGTISSNPPQDVYVAGAAGSGGGGALAMRVGNDLMVAGAAVLESKGGAGVLIRGNDANSTNNVNWGVTSPGGGGSGGSFLLQSARDLQLLGRIDTSGGAGSRTGQVSTAAISITSQAGAGSYGFYRLEARGNLTVSGLHVPAYVALDNAGPLVDVDTQSGCVSKWRGTNLVFPPQWLRYEIDVDETGNGPVVTYSDSGEPNVHPLNNPNTDPVVVQFQGASLNQTSAEPIEGTIQPWRYRVLSTATEPGLSGDGATGFRFMLTFNRDRAPNCVVRALRVYARS